MPFSQEDMVLAQAKSNILTLEPRLKVTRECVECLEKGFNEAREVSDRVRVHLDPLVSAIAQVQLSQLRTALEEIESSLSKSREVVARLESPIESPVKLFRPAGFQGQ